MAYCCEKYLSSFEQEQPFHHIFVFLSSLPPLLHQKPSLWPFKPQYSCITQGHTAGNSTEVSAQALQYKLGFFPAGLVPVPPAAPQRHLWLADALQRVTGSPSSRPPRLPSALLIERVLLRGGGGGRGGQARPRVTAPSPEHP